MSDLLYAHFIITPLGQMLALADEHALWHLSFVDEVLMDMRIKTLERMFKKQIVFETNVMLASIESELNDYFHGKRHEFKTPIALNGTPFCQRVWNALQTIPCGTTISYADLACKIDYPSALRAVARANSVNHIAIVIPCHRVINKSGALGGYAGGVARKKWLWEREKK